MSYRDLKIAASRADLLPKNRCPKCGSEMERRGGVYTLSVPERWVCKCGHEEKVEGKP